MLYIQYYFVIAIRYLGSKLTPHCDPQNDSEREPDMEILESEGVGEERGVLVLLSPVGPAVPPASRWASFRSRSFTW